MVCLLTPSSRPTSAALRPASICFNAPIISASLYFLLDMPPPPRRMRKSYILVRRFGGAGQFHYIDIQRRRSARADIHVRFFRQANQLQWLADESVPLYGPRA